MRKTKKPKIIDDILFESDEYLYACCLVSMTSNELSSTEGFFFFWVLWRVYRVKIKILNLVKCIK